MKRPTIDQYKLRVGDRVAHPFYGFGTIKSFDIRGVITCGVRWDVAPVNYTRALRSDKYCCGCDLADLTPLD